MNRRGPLLRPGEAELVQTFGEKIAEHRLAQQIARGWTTASFRGLPPQVFPFLEGSVAAAEPHQRDEVDLLVLAQRIDETGDLARDRIAPVVLEHIDHVIISGVGSGARIGRGFLDVELPGLLDQEADFFGRNREFWHRMFLIRYAITP